MKILECMIAWSGHDQVEIGPWPDLTGWSDPYAFTSGACYAHWHHMSQEQLERILAIEFLCMVVRDGVDPQAAHREFLKIDEYREHMIAPDMLGAEVCHAP